ncbi:discoidin domain-containing protein [Pedobacter sp. FW305-3-2-15-E-R2A2]|uniref:discoidin domain-containing protein n=1 Tax=Pedobacter sp. FW305-3-2-15-E-R2A2 TaxID=3140251 RepID=UPI003140ACF2
MFKITMTTLCLSLFVQTVLGQTHTTQSNTIQSKSAGLIKVDGNGSGRIFDGIGAVSAGGSSRLLIDYSDKSRSDILDYLFKPGFGAGFTYLKTEIGGDGNTTCGSEPSFARTKAEMENPNFNRGYEYWLMREAVNRNPGIELDALEWSMPGWFNGVWSQDNADYLVKFIQGAKHWGLNLKYIAGCWNERDYNRDWIVNTLRPTLNKNGLSHIKINAPEGAGKAWGIADLLVRDEEFKNTLSSISYHYPDSYMWSDNKEEMNQNALDSGLPLWSGEDFSLPGKSWRNTMYMAKNILKCYIKKKIVKVNMWCPIASMPDISCFSNVGIMKGTNPWSGYYEVWPTIWAVAHFNQFAKPGWKYIDSGCGELEGEGAYCTYKNLDGSNDYSIVIANGTKVQQLTFNISDLKKDKLQVWKSNSENQFQQQADLIAINGTITISLDAESIYSITTTTGQQKGTHDIPKEKAFPVNYADNFDQYSLEQAPLSPKYFYDNSGAFELHQSAGNNKYLRQSLLNDITHWIPDECAYTFVAQGTEWDQGQISSDVFVENDAFNGKGYAGIILRGAYDKASQANIPFGYRFNIYKDGTWKLQTKTDTLASGHVDVSKWNNLKLVGKGNSIKAFLNGKLVADVKDDRYSIGAAGYVSGFNVAKFDNLLLNYTPASGKLLSGWKPASSPADPSGNELINAFDGNSLSKWRARGDGAAQTLTVDLGTVQKMARCETFTDFVDKSLQYKIEYSTDNLKWTVFSDQLANVKKSIPCYVDESSAKARWVRLTLMPAADKTIAGIYEFKVYGDK